MNYQGVIIEESLENKDILQSVHILETQVKQVTEKHKTPWIKQWTMYKVEISENTVDSVVLKLRDSLDSQHSWYVDFKNDDFHYIIFRNKFFKIDRNKKEQYEVLPFSRTVVLLISTHFERVISSKRWMQVAPIR